MLKSYEFGMRLEGLEAGSGSSITPVCVGEGADLTLICSSLVLTGKALLRNV